MSDAIEDHLCCIYGEEPSTELRQRIEDLIRKWQPRCAAVSKGRTRPALSSRDALLITYADQLRADGRKPLEVLGEFARAQLKGVVSGIHLLPFFPWSSDDGFSVKDYYAVDPMVGSWDDVTKLGTDFDLMFDAVFNHVSAQGEWFQRFIDGDPQFQDFFVTVDGEPDLSRVVRPRALPLLTEFVTASGRQNVWTTFSADQVDLNIANPAVLLALLDVLLFYVSRGARYIRLDAIAFLCKDPSTSCLHLPATHRVIQLMRSVLDEAAPSVALITETNVPHADNISYFGDGTNEAQLVYNFALPPLVLHSFAAGNAVKLSRWASDLNLPSAQVTFFNFLASHDGIGLNPARGILSQEEIDHLVERTLKHGGLISWKNNPDGSRSPYEMNINFFDALSAPDSSEPSEKQMARFLCAHAILLSLQGMPGIYFHSLFGSRGDRAGADASGIPRRINREKFEAAAIERELAEESSPRQRIFSAFKQLLQARRDEPAFDPSATQEIFQVDERLFCVLRNSPGTGQRVACLHNVSDSTVRVPVNELESRLGAGGMNFVHGISYNIPATGVLLLSPYEFTWLRSVLPSSRVPG